MSENKHKVGDRVTVTITGIIEGIGKIYSCYKVRFYGDLGDNYGNLYVSEDQMHAEEDNSNEVLYFNDILTDYKIQFAENIHSSLAYSDSLTFCCHLMRMAAKCSIDGDKNKGIEIKNEVDDFKTQVSLLMKSILNRLDLV